MVRRASWLRPAGTGRLHGFDDAAAARHAPARPLRACRGQRFHSLSAQVIRRRVAKANLTFLKGILYKAVRSGYFIGLEGGFSLTAVFSPRLRFCRATSDKWVLWRRAADKVAVEAAAGPEKMKSTARCSSGHSQASSWLFWWRLGDASAGDHARRGS